jgi:acid phosphatase class B
MENIIGTRKIFTTAPKSLDRVEDADRGVIGTHRIGYPVRATEVPEKEFHAQIIEFWEAKHMAIDESELPEMVAKGLIQLSVAA